MGKEGDGWNCNNFCNIPSMLLLERVISFSNQFRSSTMLKVVVVRTLFKFGFKYTSNSFLFYFLLGG